MAARVTPTPLPSGEVRALPQVYQSTPDADFGQAQARQTLIAGQNLGQAGDTLANVALQEQRDINEARVSEFDARFADAENRLLFTDPDAFYRLKGDAAIKGAADVYERMDGVKKALIDEAGNPYQKQRLEKTLKAQLESIRGRVNSHVVQQTAIHEKNSIAGSIETNRLKATLNNNDIKIVEDAALSAEKAARHGARGNTEEFIEVVGRKARSAVMGDAIEARLKSEPRAALAMYDRFRPLLDPDDIGKLDTQMKSVAADVKSSDWIESQGTGASYNSRTKSLESGKREFNRLGSGAFGPYQFMPQTWAAVREQNPELNLPADMTKASDEDHEKAHEAFKTANAAGLQRAGFSPTPANLYLAHRFGSGGAASVLRADPSTPLDKTLPANWGTQNPDMRGQTAGSFIGLAQQRYSGVGFDRSNVAGVVAKAMADPNLSDLDKAAVVTKLEKESKNFETARTGQIKGLRDTLEATTQAMILAPSVYKKGMLAQLADGFEAAGEKSDAINTRVLAAHEDVLLNFATSSVSAQSRIIGLLPGKAKATAEGFLAAGKEEQAANAKGARAGFGAVKTAAKENVPFEDLDKKINGILDMAVKSGDVGLIGEISDWVEANATARAMGREASPVMDAAINQWRQKIKGGEATNSNIIALEAMEDIKRKQAAEFAKDPYAAGSTIYGMAPLPLHDLQGRSARAREISGMRDGLPVPAYSDPEFATIRNKLHAADPMGQVKLLSAFSALPPEQIPLFAAGLAGKGEASDPVSRGYAAAMSFIGESDVALREIGTQILAGTQIIRGKGDGVKVASMSSKEVRDRLNPIMGSVFRDRGGLPDVIVDAIGAVYTYRLSQSGKPDATLDPDIFDAAAKAVVGTTVTRKDGQMILPPRGVDRYDFENGVGALQDGDFTGVRTSEGNEVKAETVIRAGMLTNAGKEGHYFVRLPDPRADMTPRPIEHPDGRPFVLEIKPLIERSKLFPLGGFRARPAAPRVIDNPKPAADTPLPLGPGNSPGYVTAPSLAPRRRE